MTIKEFIEKAIEGGWRKDEAGHLEIWLPENDTRLFCDNGNGIAAHYGNETIHSVLLDPTAWQAVGKVEGWVGKKIRMCTGCGVACKNSEVTAYGKHKGLWNGQRWTGCDSDVYEYDGQWLIEMHRMIDHLAEGGTIESYLKTL